MIEALIADRAAACSAEYLADAMTWKLPRVIAAVDALERRLQQTGQTLIRDSQHRYTLSARTSLIAHQVRHRAHELHIAEPETAAADVLLRILKGPRENRRWTSFQTSESRQAIRHLLAAGLIQENGVTIASSRPPIPRLTPLEYIAGRTRRGPTRESNSSTTTVRRRGDGRLCVR